MSQWNVFDEQSDQEDLEHQLGEPMKSEELCGCGDPIKSHDRLGCMAKGCDCVVSLSQLRFLKEKK